MKTQALATIIFRVEIHTRYRLLLFVIIIALHSFNNLFKTFKIKGHMLKIHLKFEMNPNNPYFGWRAKS